MGSKFYAGLKTSQCLEIEKQDEERQTNRQREEEDQEGGVVQVLG